MKNFCVVKQVSPETARPYKILETYQTSDGLRSRICDGQWETLEEAESIASSKVSVERDE